MMEMEADRMRNLALRPTRWRPSAQVILEERNQRIESDPGALFSSEQMRAAQYLNHPYGIPIIGWRHEMEELSLEDAQAFYRTSTTAPNNAILIVAGDVTPDEVRALAEKHYGADPRQSRSRHARTRPREPPQLAERRLSFEDPRVAQPYVDPHLPRPRARCRRAGARRRRSRFWPRSWAARAQTSVLGQKLQFETQIALYTAAFYSGVSLDDTTFGLVIVPAEGMTLAEAEAALDAGGRRVPRGRHRPRRSSSASRSQVRAVEIYGEDDLSGARPRYGMALTSGLTGRRCRRPGRRS